MRSAAVLARPRVLETAWVAGCVGRRRCAGSIQALGSTLPARRCGATPRRGSRLFLRIERLPAGDQSTSSRRTEGRRQSRGTTTSKPDAVRADQEGPMRPVRYGLVLALVSSFALSGV